VLLAMTSWWSDHEQLVRISKAYDASPSADLYGQLLDQTATRNRASIKQVKEPLELDNQVQVKGSRDALAASEGASRLTFLVSLALMIVGTIVALGLGVFISLSITRPLARGVAFARHVAAGDLTTRLDIHRRDEVGELADALNDMVVKLRDTISTVQSGALKVSAASEQIAAGARKLAEGAQSQASTLEETSASVEELTSSVDQVADHAQGQASAATEGAGSLAQVLHAIDSVSQRLTEIASLATTSVDNALAGARSVSEVVEGINLIAGSSEKISGILGVISDIADQTNLLALNASIEAARAGEHGRGFSVVAQEVSKLSDRSSAATKEIAALIKESTRNVGKGVEKATGSQITMEHIRAASQQVQDMIAGLSESMTAQVQAVKHLSTALASVSEMSQSISAATEEQTTNAKQLSKAVEDVNEVTQGAASAAEQMSASTAQLTVMAQELQGLVEQFRIGGEAAAPGAPSRAAPGVGRLGPDEETGVKVVALLDESIY
ncbi:MAG TPA: methyl-accepting chemotaxis protein, partial [Spirochaetia bacterium]